VLGDAIVYVELNVNRHGMESRDFALRPARPGEGEVLYQLAVLSARTFCGTHYASHFIDTWMAGLEHDAYEPGIAAGNLVVAESASEPVGFVEWNPGRIERLYVTQSGQGIGAALLRLGEQQASGEDRSPIELEAALNAVNFYERHGYIRLEPGVFGGRPPSLIPIPMMRMRKTLFCHPGESHDQR